jgi:hypothetical protein
MELAQVSAVVVALIAAALFAAMTWAGHHTH